MRAYERLKDLEALSLGVTGSYDVAYEYDAQNRVEKEIITGAIVRTTVFTYDANENIDTETITTGGKTISKQYVYDPVTNNITNIHVTVA